MRKKIMASCLLATMVISLVGCGNKENTNLNADASVDASTENDVTPVTMESGNEYYVWDSSVSATITMTSSYDSIVGTVIRYSKNTRSTREIDSLCEDSIDVEKAIKSNLADDIVCYIQSLSDAENLEKTKEQYRQFGYTEEEILELTTSYIEFNGDMVDASSFVTCYDENDNMYSLPREAAEARGYRIEESTSVNVAAKVDTPHYVYLVTFRSENPVTDKDIMSIITKFKEFYPENDIVATSSSLYLDENNAYTDEHPESVAPVIDETISDDMPTVESVPNSAITIENLDEFEDLEFIDGSDKFN